MHPFMSCVCGHDERQHDSRTAPYACRNCGCVHYRWDAIDWTAPQMVVLQQEKAAS